MLLDEKRLKELMKDAVREVRAEEKQWLSVGRAAHVADVHADTIRRWVETGKLQRYGAGREVRVLRADLERLLEEMGKPEPLTPALGPKRSAEEKQRENVLRMFDRDE